MAGTFTHNGNIVQGLPSIASQVNYDNTASRLSATQVQDAIDTLAGDTAEFVGTTSQWEALSTAQKKSYAKANLTNDYTATPTAAQVSYNNTTSGMTASNVQGAVDELKNGLADLKNRVAGVFITSSYRGAENSNDITVYDHSNGRFGAIITTDGIFTFRDNGITLEATSTGLTVTDLGNNKYRLGCSGSWYTACVIISTMKIS